MKNRLIIFFFGIISLLGGFAIYLFFRFPGGPFYQELPAEEGSWIIYSLPNLLWMYSYFLIMYTIWMDYKRREFLVWALIGLIFGIGFELSQFIGLFKGTFDWNDIYAVIGGAILGLTFIIFLRKPTSHMEVDQAQ